MKRMHVHVGVDDLAASTRFYSALFGAAPTVTKPDYAKWMLDDPHLNFAISAGHASRGIEHLGIQVEDDAELAEVYGRLEAADRPVLDEGATTCCYAKSTKAWISDPQGVMWETFLTAGDATIYGSDVPLASIVAAEGNCCAPATAPKAIATPRAQSCC